MDANSLWREGSVGVHRQTIASGWLSGASTVRLYLNLWLLMLLIAGFARSPAYAACDGCVAPIAKEWLYQAATCASYIPPQGFSPNEGYIVAAVQDAIDNCPQFSGFNDTGWPETVQYFGGSCGGGTDVPKYALGIERYNRRQITSGCGGYTIDRNRGIGCPGNTIRYYDYLENHYYNLCKAVDNQVSDDKNMGPTCPGKGENKDGKEGSGSGGNPSSAGNPINVAFGNKVQVETDLAPGSLTGLGIARYYNSKHIDTDSV